MEELLLQEKLNDEKLEELKIRRNALMSQTGEKSIKTMPTPVDSSLEAKATYQEAMHRNAEFLHELDISTAKLHTKRLCPINEKLQELKVHFWESQQQK